MIRTESEGWMALAEYMDNHESNFICLALNHVRNCSSWIADTPNIVPDTLTAMCARLREHLHARATEQRDWPGITLLPDGSAYVAYSPEIAQEGMMPEETKPARVLACLMFGWEAKSEGR